MDFPQYRKYTNNKSYFKVHSESVMEEIQLLGKRAFYHRLEAKILPERNLINDLLFNYEPNWEKISEAEYQSIEEQFGPFE